MKIEIRERDRRALAALVLVIGVYFGVTEFILPQYDLLKQDSASVSEKEEKLRKFRQTKLRKGQYVQLVDQAKKQVEQAESLLIRTSTPALASVEMQSMIEQVTKKLSIEPGLRSVALPKKLNDSYSELAMSLTFECSPGNLMMFLSEIRALPKIMTVRTLQVIPVQPVAEAPKSGPFTKNLRVSVTIATLQPLVQTK